MNVLNSSEKYVYCPLCKFGSAILKFTKTDHLMLRCDECMLLMFANSSASQNALLRTCKVQATVPVDQDLERFSEYYYH